MGSMYVWIPRYAYAITSNYHNGGNGISGTIKIAFLDGTKTYNIGSEVTYKYQGNSERVKLTNKTGESNWNEHPAFKFGGTILSGIWVAKFEASRSDAGTDKDSMGTSSTIKIQPNVTSWRDENIGDIFTYCQNMNSSNKASIYGISTNKNIIDPHLIKNIEWGAVAYLTQSSYGRNGKEPYINNSSDFITGNSGGSTSASTSSGARYRYTTPNGQKASTTGNVSGIYDMSGGSLEYVACYVNNGDSSLTENANSLLNANSKYKDVTIMGSGNSSSSNYDANRNIYGDAIYETSKSYEDNNGWFYDRARYFNSANPFLMRGGYISYGSNAGIFSFYISSGINATSNSFRPVLTVL